MSIWVVLLSVLAFAIPVTVVFVAGMTVSEPLWRGSPLLAPLFATVSVAVVSWLAFIAFWLNSWIGFGFATLVLAASIVVAAHGGLWRRWRDALPVASLVVGAIVFYLGFTYLWGPGNGVYDLIQSRFFNFVMPVDNTIPSLFAQKIAAGEPTHLMLGDWNGGDRPPLQSGFELLFRPLSGLAQVLTGHPFTAAPPTAVTFALDLLAQLIWIPVGYALLRQLSFRRWVAIGGVAFALFVPSIMVNTVFTWPKVMSAALVLCALAFLLAAKRSPNRFGLLFASAIIAAVFAVLAHGAAAFAIPALVVVGVYALWRRPLRATVKAVAIGVGIGLVAYVPWIIYQRFIDPPGDRLLKWHLAGVTAIDPRPFVQTFLDQYSALSGTQFIANRLENLSTVFGSDQFERLSDARFDLVTFLRVEDYTSTMVATSLIGLVLLVIMVLSLTGRLRSLPAAELQRLLLVAGMMLSVAIWAFVLFTPFSAIVPHGSHAWLLIFTTVPFAWMLERTPRLGVALLAAQALSLVIVYFRNINHDARFSTSGFLVMAAGLVFLVVVPLISAAWLDRRAARSATISAAMPATRITTPAGRTSV
ncbi:hypothetical protein N1027_00490 [Herbiconiux sp. CPCC 205763]|uniref:Glycosyltransferase RgtA/B/C/D-like domain-containing protein n=1 Tax=Herbiconiux aconitum TaxID=2970913 RepID=A0ABT2GK73_9MICO|nr:hypothetical protein [Herbiconiux aconitum]MCS5716609.1 hypothetical protein [Herbiconiux aconitum]